MQTHLVLSQFQRHDLSEGVQSGLGGGVGGKSGLNGQLGGNTGHVDDGPSRALGHHAAGNHLSGCTVRLGGTTLKSSD